MVGKSSELYLCRKSRHFLNSLTEIPYFEALSITGLGEKSCELHLVRKMMIVSLVHSDKTLLFRGFFLERKSPIFCVLQNTYRYFISQASIETIHLHQSASIGTIYFSLPSLSLYIYVYLFLGILKGDFLIHNAC